MKLAVSGHQPHHLGGFTPEVFLRLHTLAKQFIADTQPSEVITGLAAGWDVACAQAAIELGVPLVSALAHPRQGHNWPEDAKRDMDWLVERSAQVHIACPKWQMDCWTVRDHWVLDRGDFTVVLYGGGEGGTAQAIDYLHSVGKPWANVWEDWLSLCKQATP
jgi:hypothetical protein